MDTLDLFTSCNFSGSLQSLLSSVLLATLPAKFTSLGLVIELTGGLTLDLGDLIVRVISLLGGNSSSAVWL